MPALRPFLIVRDGFYADPDAVRRAAQAMDYRAHEDITGYMTERCFHERGIRARLERVLGVRITRWDEDPEDGNGIFYMAFSKGKRRETPGVHSDEPDDDITVLIYLTPALPAGCGTSIWQHKRTGLTFAPTRADARRLGMTLTRLRAELERDSEKRDRWIEIDRVGYRYNRLVAYPSGILHSASRHFGTDLDGGRIYQTFRIGVDWSTLRLCA
jgi:hypothetical protein